MVTAIGSVGAHNCAIFKALYTEKFYVVKGSGESDCCYFLLVLR